MVLVHKAADVAVLDRGECFQWGRTADGTPECEDWGPNPFDQETLDALDALEQSRAQQD